MRFSFFALALAALAPLTSAVRCGNEDYDYDPLNITSVDSRRSLNHLSTRATATIQVYFHVLISKAPTGDWGPSFDSQIKYLNNHFGKWGYQFKLKFTLYVINANWASDIETDKTNKMNQLHRGDYQTLNVYLVEGAGGGVCSFPDGSGNPVDQTLLNRDGCFVPLSVGRSPTSGTLAHEIGHWLGLLHTFQGGCTGNGDFCDDTYPQKEPSYGKLATPEDLNSCPAKDTCGKGPANVRNFMDYSDCCHEFTPCQGGRMNTAWTKYRNGRKLASGVQLKW